MDREPAGGGGKYRWFYRPGAVVLVAGLAAALFFGGVFVADRVNPAASGADELIAIVASPDLLTVTAPVQGGVGATLVASEGRGTAVLVVEGLPELSAEQVYAVWYFTDGEPTPAGFFTVDAGAEGETIVQVLEGLVGTGAVIAVTVEARSGGPAPTTAPIVVMETTQARTR